MQRAAVLFVPLALVATSLTGCGLLDGSSRLEDALEVVPGSATRVTFVDRVAIAERFEVDDVESDSDEEEVAEYVEASREFPYGTALDRHLVALQEEDAPFTALDVEWEVSGIEEDGSVGRVWKMRDDLDLEEVGDELVDEGFEEGSAEGDARSFSIPLEDLDPGTGASFGTMQQVTIVPDEHLVITGPLAEQVLEVVHDDADSAVDTGMFEELVDSTDDVEVAVLGRDDDACRSGSTELSPEQLGASGIDELGTPEQTGFFVHGDEGDARSVMVFDEEDAAEEDAEAREDFLDDGRSPASGVPYSELGDWEIDTDGNQVRIDVDYENPAAISAIVSRDDYLSVCLPDAG